MNGGGTDGKQAVREACPCVMGGENSGRLCGEQREQNIPPPTL